MLRGDSFLQFDILALVSLITSSPELLIIATINYMAIKLILFDIDNTLIFGKNADKFYNQYYLALQKLVSLKMKLSEVEAKNIIIEHILSGFRSETILNKLGIDMILLYNILIKLSPSNYLKPAPSVKNILRKLRNKNVKLGFITDSPLLVAYRILEATKIEREIFDIRIGWQKGRKMPKAGSIKIYKAICKKYRLNPQEIIMIGDSLENDITPARKAGFHTIFITKDNTYFNEITIPSIKSLSQALMKHFYL